MAPQDSLAVLAPASRTVAFRGEELVVTPLRLEQLPAFIAATRTIIGRVVAASRLAEVETLQAGAVILDMLMEDSMAFARACAVVTGRDENWLAGGTLEEIGDLVEAIVALNTRFFAQRLPSLLKAVRAGAAPAQANQSDSTGGRTPSTSSSPEDTTAGTS